MSNGLKSGNYCANHITAVWHGHGWCLLGTSLSGGLVSEVVGTYTLTITGEARVLPQMSGLEARRDRDGRRGIRPK